MITMEITTAVITEVTTEVTGVIKAKVVEGGNTVVAREAAEESTGEVVEEEANMAVNMGTEGESVIRCTSILHTLRTMDGLNSATKCLGGIATGRTG